MRSLIPIILAAVFSMSAHASFTLGSFTGDAAMTELDTGQELFRLTDANGDVDDATFFLMEGTGPFSIFDPVALTSLTIFSALDTAITSATLSWDIFTNEVTNIGSGESAIIDWNSFAIIDDTLGASTQDGGTDDSLVFEVGESGHPSLLGANVAVVWQDVSRSAGYSMITASDVAPIGSTEVSESGILAYLGVSLIGFTALRKRRG